MGGTPSFETSNELLQRSQHLEQRAWEVKATPMQLQQFYACMSALQNQRLHPERNCPRLHRHVTCELAPDVLRRFVALGYRTSPAPDGDTFVKCVSTDSTSRDLE